MQILIVECMLILIVEQKLIVEAMFMYDYTLSTIILFRVDMATSLSDRKISEAES